MRYFASSHNLHVLLSICMKNTHGKWSIGEIFCDNATTKNLHGVRNPYNPGMFLCAPLRMRLEPNDQGDHSAQRQPVDVLTAHYMCAWRSMLGRLCRAQNENILGVSFAPLLGPSASPRAAHQIQSAKQRSDFSGEATACSALSKQEPHEFEIHFLARNGRHPGAR